MYFSKSAMILCEMLDENTFNVINGNWELKKLNNNLDEYKIVVTNKIIVLPDLVKISRKEFNRKYPNFGY